MAAAQRVLENLAPTVPSFVRRQVLSQLLPSAASQELMGEERCGPLDLRAHYFLALGESTNKWILPLQEVRRPGWAIRAQDKLQAERTGAPIEMENCHAAGSYVIRSLKDFRAGAKENEFQTEDTWYETV